MAICNTVEPYYTVKHLIRFRNNKKKEKIFRTTSMHFMSLLKLLIYFVIMFQVYINPELKVLDYNKVVFSESCESMRGYAAEVPRYKKVLVSGKINVNVVNTHS